MNKATENKMSKYIMYLLIYFIIVVISGVFKTNIITSVLEPEIVKPARISAYISIAVSGIFAVFLIYILSSICYFVNSLLKTKIKNITIVDALGRVILVFIGFEVVKFLMVIFMLSNDMESISLQEDLITQIENTDWFFYSKYFKYAMLLLGAYIFGVELEAKTKNVKYKNVLALSAVLFLSLFISTVKLF
ncbi:hypothetical protein [Pontimicrobium sp. MEBiC06410]